MARAHPKKTWAALRAAYRRGEGSIAELGPKFGIPKSTAEKRAARDGWQVERQDTGRKAEAKARESDVESVARMLGRHRGLANRLLRLVEKRLQEAEDAPPKEPEQDGAVPGLFDPDPDPLSPHRLDVLSSVVARMIPVERLAAGIEPSRPVKPVEMNDDAEVVFEIDAPPEDEAST